MPPDDPAAISLVFHPPKEQPVGSPSSAFADAVRAVLEASDRELRVVSPYLGGRVLGSILHGRTFRLVTDLAACFDAGADDGVHRILLANLDWSRHLPNVHAKTLFNDAAALIGSANLTENGLAGRDELACLIQDPRVLTNLAEWFEALWSTARAITVEQLALVITSARERDLVVGKKNQLATAEVGLRPPRTLGWMHERRAEIEQRSPRTSASAAEHMELAAVLRRWTRSEDEAKDVLDLFAEALEVSGLGVDDARLHVNFGPSTKWPVNIVIGKRSVAWLDDRRCFCGLLLDDTQLAERTVKRLQRQAYSGLFRRPDAPSLNLHVEQLRSALHDVRESWHRAIRTEVDRMTKSGTPYTNPYRRHHRASLLEMLSDHAVRSQIARLAHRTRYWWFGINNGPSGHVQLTSIVPFFNGTVRRFEWPIGSSKPKALYALMQRGDRVLLWTGHGHDPRWGLLGTGAILESHEDHVVLHDARPFAAALTPYPKDQPEETEDVHFLMSTFGQEFAPLGDVMRAAFGTARRAPVTIAEISSDSFDAVTRMARTR